MAAMTDSASNTHSPKSSGFSGDSVNSPQNRRRSLPSPWAQVVRGETETIATVDRSPPPPSSPPNTTTSNTVTPPDQASVAVSDSSSPPENSVAESNNSNAVKKPAWNKPPNGVVEASPVMGADIWPALSESTKIPSKQSSDPSKTVPDGSLSVSQGPVISPTPHKQGSNNANPSPTTPIQQPPVRQKLMKQRHGGSGGFNRPPPPPPPPPPFQLVEMAAQNSYPRLVPPPMPMPIPMPMPVPVPVPVPVPDSSPREPPYRNSNWDSRPTGGYVSPNEHQRNNNSRRGGYGAHYRGDGSYHNNHGGRRDHDRGNYEWSHPRAVGVRDVHMQSQRAPPRAFIRPPPGSGPFIPQPVRAFGNPMNFPDMAPPVIYVPALHPDSFRPVPFVAPPPPPPMFYPVQDHLTGSIIHQIDYYFSDANLLKDEYLKQNMDEQGWVPITLIAGFNRVKNLTSNIQLILDALRGSTVVEVQGDKVRRRNEWMKWLSSDKLAASFQRVTVEETSTNSSNTVGKADACSEVVQSEYLPELTRQSHLSNGEGANKDTVPTESDHSVMTQTSSTSL
ncbi:La-type HTH domain [Dillenia turbinata]|uniref:La-type HTH domain n=1 Tax=Dillenia turbinata TaxID=194707 RepID=A0AAN8VZL4_9MAGN